MDERGDPDQMQPPPAENGRWPVEGAVARYSLDVGAAAIWPSTLTLLSEDVFDHIARHAAMADECGELSTSTIDRLRNAGYFGLAVPAALKGGGAGLLQCAAVQRRLGMVDPALAIAVNMHLFSVGMAVEHWLRRRDSCGLLLEAIATQNRIVASAFAEPGLGGSLMRSTVRARSTTGGYRVTGVKSPCSLAAHCDLVCFQMQAEATGSNTLMTALMPSKVPGVRVEATWDAIGMRASGSDTLFLDDCFVPDELIFHRCEPGGDYDEIFAAGLVWFCVTTTATYLGVVRAALDAACDSLKRSTVPDLGSARADSPSVQGQLGELIAPTLAIEAACATLADRIDSRNHDPRSLVPFAVALKHVSVDACIHAVEASAELLGGKSYARTGIFARLWRDVQAARFHPPTRLTSRQLLGKWALGLPFGLELDDGPSGGRSAEDVAGRR
jgi:alkylation response protein AidB-like acyl-CoA dehydrogenase